MATSTMMLTAATLVSSLLTPGAVDFLGAQRHGQVVAKEVIEQMLLMELPSSENRDRLATLQEQLRHTFEALPKNEQGHLDPTTVRYALHRHFFHQYGWSVNGLDPEGGGWNSSSSSSASAVVMKGLAPAYIENLFAKRLHGHGLGLEELAVFAATLSDLVFQESLGVLRSAYDKLALSTVDSLPEESFDLVVRGFLVEIVLLGEVDYTEFPSLELEAKGNFPEYDDTMMLSWDLFRTQDYLANSRQNPFVASGVVSSDRAAKFLRGFVEKFGEISAVECAGLKQELVKMEQAGTGRVLLSDFYKNTALQLHENVDYLRNLGVLENENSVPRLIIANYITAPSRCIPISSYYSVCCSDECEGLMGRLEREIGQPSATPALIASIVSNMPSDTVNAPRNISTMMMSRLHEIAGHHKGRVPLHGRLFMQWMHHAYPRECSYPHVAGTTKPVSQDEWLIQNSGSEDVLVSDEERAHHTREHTSVDSITPQDLPWVAEEELVAHHEHGQRKTGSGTFRVVVCIIAVLSFAVPLLRASSVLFSHSSASSKADHFV